MQSFINGLIKNNGNSFDIIANTQMFLIGYTHVPFRFVYLFIKEETVTTNCMIKLCATQNRTRIECVNYVKQTRNYFCKFAYFKIGMVRKKEQILKSNERFTRR